METKEQGKLIGEAIRGNNLQTAVLFILGVAIAIFMPKLFYKLIGVFLALVSLIVWWTLKDRKAVSVYEKSVIVYDDRGDVSAILRNDDITEWKIDANNPTVVIFRLKNDENVTVNTLSAGRVCDLLLKTLPKKTTMELIRERLHGTPQSGFLKTIKELIQRRKKK